MSSSIPALDTRTIKYLNDSGIANEEALIGTRLAEDRVDIDALDTGVTALEAEVETLDTSVVVVPLVANNASVAYIVKPTARTVASISFRRQAAIASSLGTVTAGVVDGDINRILSTPTIDATALTASFVAQTLTGITANLSLAAGEPLVITLTSDNADATGGPLIVRVTYS